MRGDFTKSELDAVVLGTLGPHIVHLHNTLVRVICVCVCLSRRVRYRRPRLVQRYLLTLTPACSDSGTAAQRDGGP